MFVLRWVYDVVGRVFVVVFSVLWVGFAGVCGCGNYVHISVWGVFVVVFDVFSTI